jgi:hypothetical protein
MNISSSVQSFTQVQNTTTTKNLFTQKLSKDEVEGLRAQIKESMNAFTFKSTNIQTGIVSKEDKFAQSYKEFQSFLKDVGYRGKPIADLSQNEAAALVSEDGIFGIKQTSERIANFVIQGSGGNEDLLRAGREGMLQGFKDAQHIWGSKLPDISQKTIQKATELVDKAMHDLGFSIINKEA